MLEIGVGDGCWRWVLEMGVGDECLIWVLEMLEKVLG